MNRLSERTLLSDTLNVLLPNRAETVFLKACLGIETEACWRTWQLQEPELRAALKGSKPAYKRLLPLLYYQLTCENVVVAEADLTVLRLAALWEERRAARINSVLATIIQALEQVSVEPVLSKGVALANLAYPKASLRHCHDIDLLVPQDRLEVATEVLRHIGFATTRPKGSRRAALVLSDRAGLPVSLHTDLPNNERLGAESVDAAGRALRVDVAGVTTQALEPVDMIALMAAQLLTGQVRDRTSWVVDSVFLLRQANLNDLQWQALADRARNSGLAIPVFAMVSYLRSEFEIAVPIEAQRRLGCEANREPTHVRDRLLALMRGNPELRFGEMIRSSGWRSRLDLLRSVVIPSNTYLRAWCQDKGLPWSPAWYVARPFRRLLKRAGILSGLRSAAAVEGKFK